MPPFPCYVSRVDIWRVRCNRRSGKILVSCVNIQKTSGTAQHFTQNYGHCSSSHHIWCMKSMQFVCLSFIQHVLKFVKIYTLLCKPYTLGCSKIPFFWQKKLEPAKHQPGVWFESTQKDFWIWQSLRGPTAIQSLTPGGNRVDVLVANHKKIITLFQSSCRGNATRVFTGDGCEWPEGAGKDVWRGRNTWIQHPENSWRCPDKLSASVM